MKSDFADVTAILLAGGSSSRMGTEKGLVLLDGKALVEYALEALQTVFEKIIISSNSNAFDGYGWPVVADEFPGCGPLSGIFSGLKNIETEYAFVLSYDMPFVGPELIMKILQYRHEYQVVLPVVNKIAVPVCALYQRSVLPQIETNLQLNKLKLIRIVDELSHFNIALSSNDENQLFSLNTMHDLHIAETIQHLNRMT